VPDNILKKPGKLTEEEFELMKRHSEKGREIIDSIMADFGLDNVRYLDMLRNIAEHHHEAINGSGYPDGLAGDAIPIEARIIAVADVFDALTSHRPYKERWSNDEAIAMLRRLVGIRLDKDCVEALIKNRKEVESIQQQFTENQFG
jgi:HD-GYP domain-containing protein (c-di-GMP phosphodiesterase class II)